MTAALVGRVSIGQVVPATAGLVASSLGDLQARLAGAIAAQVGVTVSPPTILGTIQALADAAAALQASLDIGFPAVSIDVGGMATLIADLNAQIALLLSLSVTLGTAGVFAFTHQGDSLTYGSEMQAQVSAVSPPGNTIRSVTFMCSDPAVFELLGAVLLTG